LVEFRTITVSGCCLTKLLPYILFDTYIYILPLEMASARNQHRASCIGTLSCATAPAAGLPRSRRTQREISSHARALRRGASDVGALICTAVRRAALITTDMSRSAAIITGRCMHTRRQTSIGFRHFAPGYERSIFILASRRSRWMTPKPLFLAATSRPFSAVAALTQHRVK